MSSRPLRLLVTDKSELLIHVGAELSLIIKCFLLT